MYGCSRLVIFLSVFVLRELGGHCSWMDYRCELNIVSSRGWLCSVAICPRLLFLIFTADLYICTIFSDLSISCCLCHAFGRPSWIHAVICSLQHETVIQIIAGYLRKSDESSDAKWHVITLEISMGMMMGLWNGKKDSEITKMQTYVTSKLSKTR